MCYPSNTHQLIKHGVICAPMFVEILHADSVILCRCTHIFLFIYCVLNVLLFIHLQVELATGVFPYANCKTDFEVLAKVLEQDPPMLPPGKGFSINFCSFVSTW